MYLIQHDLWHYFYCHYFLVSIFIYMDFSVLVPKLHFHLYFRIKDIGINCVVHIFMTLHHAVLAISSTYFNVLKKVLINKRCTGWNAGIKGSNWKKNLYLIFLLGVKYENESGKIYIYGVMFWAQNPRKWTLPLKTINSQKTDFRLLYHPRLTTR